MNTRLKKKKKMHISEKRIYLLEFIKKNSADYYHGRSIWLVVAAGDFFLPICNSIIDICFIIIYNVIRLHLEYSWRCSFVNLIQVTGSQEESGHTHNCACKDLNFLTTEVHNY